MKKICGLFILSVALLTTGCASEIAGLHHDPTLTHKSIRSKNIIVTGVFCANGTFAKTDRNAYSTILVERFQNSNNDLKIVGSVEHAHISDNADYLNLMSHYKQTGAVNRSMAEKIKGVTDDAGYLLFARIEDQRIARTKSIQNDYDYFRSFRNYRRIPRYLTNRQTHYYTYRIMTVSIDIYDLEREKIVWGGQMTQSLRNQRKSYVQWDSELFSSYPKAPSVAETLAVLFADFAAQIP